MKTITIITTVFLLFVSSYLLAQESSLDNREKFKFGLKAGGNYSNVYNSKTDAFRADPKFGLAGGVFLILPIGKYFGIQPEVLISQKGFQGEGTILGSQYNFKRTSTYIDIPLQLALKPSEFITLIAGPQYSYLVKQKDVFTNTSFSYEQEQIFKNEDIRKNILGFVVGINLNLRGVILGSRLGWDIIENHGDGSYNTPQYKNTWFQVTLGLTL
jgi:hypothetical protein